MARLETRLLVLVREVRVILVGGGTFSATQKELQVIVAGGGGILRGGQAELDILLADVLIVLCWAVLPPGQTGLEVPLTD